ncbi:ribosomal protein S12 methylthiotransferase RimO [Tannerella forsythia KS16]|jgi:ribosomal protein S12 methylthiotransferase RimO|uniref:Ribosomal protein uS12 methylthiotransferase RimO n=1 Tax=Tannerella forsythia TaxID=28112 RepID=A0A1D3UYQ4_TANFO|nr:30S ribosomal protein S12 methylthiotransferase RimO [Tannerella forsythia]PDP71888.1 30S ribosomal protein S12 methylthiotransferase RimO [Tannerella forsythia]BAR52792.1 ribosomal protein S12 methylthiotransferase RimO [Tannerella forsythia KS16]SCQ24213.1 Ribosomal protein S12 methylthiotransferase RimO [Tannerella forsythia]SCQ25098.1 Ribosomal protein S12 methylthiotransferase RimO [Tannerella forsythia]
MRKNKVDIITLGCSKNLVDSEQLMRQFQLNGYTVTHDAEKVNGEFVVVNTCAFIGDAQEESINLILALGEEKDRGRIGKLFVMGCLSERFLKELKTELPFVDRFYGKFNWKELLNDIGKAYHPESSTDRVVTTPGHYAYLKIAEGCNRTCSYCSIPIITGKYRSRPMDEIIDEARLLTRKGVKEIQLIAQDLTYYGLDIYHKTVLPELVERLSDISGIQWIRLHYGYPSQFPHDLLRVIRERENVCKYLDIALQHISDPMLKRMRRRITKQETYELIGRIREEVPGIHLRTTLMVGYPGETDDDYAELMQFAQDVRFERMGAFAYSHEVGTYSYKNHQDDVGEEVKQQRLDTLMRLQQKISTEVQKEKVGKVFKVMLDREEDFYIGRTEYDSPEVDPEVLVSKEQKLQPGKFYAARIESSEAFELYGKIVG